MLHVALIGYGLSGQTIQAPFFAQHPLFRLKRVVTNSQDPTQKYPGVLKTPRLEDVLQDDEIDLV
ncbi:MAG: oxidoreductase, partial [Haliscomenobacter sp.]